MSLVLICRGESLKNLILILWCKKCPKVWLVVLQDTNFNSIICWPGEIDSGLAYICLGGDFLMRVHQRNEQLLLCGFVCLSLAGLFVFFFPFYFIFQPPFVCNEVFCLLRQWLLEAIYPCVSPRYQSIPRNLPTKKKKRKAPPVCCPPSIQSNTRVLRPWKPWLFLPCWLPTRHDTHLAGASRPGIKVL